MSKEKRGRHAAHAKTSNGDTPQTPSASAPVTPSLSESDLPTLGQSTAPHSAVPAPQHTAVMPSQLPARPVNQQGAYGAPGNTGFAPGGPMLPVDVSEVDVQRSRKPLKILGIVLLALLALLLAAYVAGAAVFMDRFMPHTTLGNMDVSLKSSAEVQDMLSETISDYTLKVDGLGFSLVLSSSDAGMDLDGQKVTDAMHASVNPWMWPLEMTKQHDESDKLAASYNESGLGDKVRATIEEFNAEATPPTNATVTFDTTATKFVIQPEAGGTTLDTQAVITAIDEAVVELAPTVKLTKEELAQPTVLSTDAALKTAADKANAMVQTDMELTMAGTTAAEVNAELVSQWITFGEDLSVTLNDEALVAWVDELAAQSNTVGAARTYTRPDGKVITVSGGNYGWSVDYDTLLGIVKDGIANGNVATIEIPCATTGVAYNGAGAQDWGARYLDIDLAEQYVRFYDASGALIWESACITGKPDGQHDTSVGVFWMNQMASPSKLIGYENGQKIYETTVQYWMPFVGNAIGLHDADWQAAFGGTLYRDGAGSHGCVNLPPHKAAELYGMIQGGDVVVSHW